MQIVYLGEVPCFMLKHRLTCLGHQHFQFVPHSISQTRKTDVGLCMSFAISAAFAWISCAQLLAFPSLFQLLQKNPFAVQTRKMACFSFRPSSIVQV